MSEAEKIQDSFYTFQAELMKLCAKFRDETGMDVMSVQADRNGLSLTAISGVLKFELSKSGSSKGKS